MVSTKVASRNALTRSLGTGTASMESTMFDALPGDRILLCSDAIAEEEIAGVLETFSGDPEKAAHGLVTAALEASRPDKGTVWSI